VSRRTESCGTRHEELTVCGRRWGRVTDGPGEEKRVKTPDVCVLQERSFPPAARIDVEQQGFAAERIRAVPPDLLTDLSLSACWLLTPRPGEQLLRQRRGSRGQKRVASLCGFGGVLWCGKNVTFMESIHHAEWNSPRGPGVPPPRKSPLDFASLVCTRLRVSDRK